MAENAKTMRYSNPNMLLRIAQADAYALACEYCVRHPSEPEFNELLEFKRYIAHPTYGEIKPGCYTDDTQMSIALAEALIDSKNCEGITHEMFYQYWFNTFKRDPRKGYSSGFQMQLELAESADSLRASLHSRSTKNGAAMRSVPLGVIADVELVKSVAATQACTTHSSYEGVASSVAVALMSHYALYDGRSFSSMPRWLSKHVPLFENIKEPWSGPVKGKSKISPYDVGINTAWAVQTLLTTKHSLKDVMLQVIEWGGDTDSVAAIAWGIASCRHQDEELPEFFERDLETGGAYGPEFLKELGKRLMNTYV